MRRSPRWNLLLFVVLALASAAYAQYLLRLDEEQFGQPALFYLVAIVLFLFAWRESSRLAAPTARVAVGFRGKLYRAIESPEVLFTVLAVLLGLIAAQDSVAREHSREYASTILLWLSSIGALIAAFVPWARVRALDRKAVREWVSLAGRARVEIAAVGGIVLLALILRAFDLEHLPINFGGDEGEMAVTARAYLTGQLTNPFGVGWFSHPSMFFFLQGLLMKLYGPTVTGARIISALLGTLSVLTAYLLVRELHGRVIAFLTAALLAVLPYHIHFSRLGLNNIGDPLWAGAAFWLLVKGVKARSRLYFVLAGLVIGFGQYFYFGSRLLLLLAALFMSYWLLQERRAILSLWSHFLVLGLAVLVVLLPLIFFWQGHSDTFYGRFTSMSVLASGWLDAQAQATGQSAVAILLQRTVNSFLVFNAVTERSGFYDPGTPLLPPAMGILFLFGLIIALAKGRERRYFLFIMWFIVAVILGAVLVLEVPEGSRLLTTTVPLMFFVALAIRELAKLPVRVLGAHPQLARGLMAATLAELALLSIGFYFLDYTPRRTYAGNGGRMYTDLAHYLQARPDNSEVYFFGPPYDFIQHGIIRYLVPGLDAMDVDHELNGPPDFVLPSKHAIFVFTSKRPGDFPQIQKAYPDGERTDFSFRGEELFFVYVVDRPQQSLK